MAEFELSKQAYIDKHNQSLIGSLQHDDFRRQKSDWVKTQILERGARTYLDFGFGAGELLEDLAASASHFAGLVLSGVDPSESLRREIEMRNPSRTFHKIASSLDAFDDSSQDLISVFNVLHHIAPDERDNTARMLSRKLRPGGTLLVWEHNPYNLGTQFIVCRCEYDHDAVLLSMKEALELFSNSQLGLQIERREYVNVTPPKWHQKSWARQLELSLSQVPVGAQYRLVLRKSS